MARRTIRAWLRRPTIGGAFVTALIGVALWSLPLGAGLKRLSFDLSTTAFGARQGFPELVLVEMDESSHDALKQVRGKLWDPRLHARLVDYLRTDGAGAVVFDVTFYERGDDPNAIAEFANALRTHGRVVLAASMEHVAKNGLHVTEVRRPVSGLLVPGVTWGVAWNIPGPRDEEDGVVRFHPRGRDPDASLPWVAAVAAGAEVTKAARHDAARWVRHYGPARTLPSVSYRQATNEAPGFYRGKTIFIGGRPGIGFMGEEGDQFRTPCATVSGLELTATAWLNLVRHDWLTRALPATELPALVLFGVLTGGAVACGSIRRATVCGGLAFVVAVGVMAWLFQRQNIWCDWAVAAFVQVPVAIAWRLASGYRELRREKEWLEAPLQDLFPASTSRSGSPVRTPSPASHPLDTPGHRTDAGAPAIPEFTLLRCVGRGAYGEVWLARDVLGGFRAVKIVRRVAFDDDGPYEREFRGLQTFAPVSREHPGLIQVLHVGLNRAGGFFYYVMEAGDDEHASQRIDPDHYAPRNLGRDLRLRGRWSPARTVPLALALCDALDFLHGRGLIHRDIKPTNVIFIGGRPRLADVGLVTEIASRPHGVTQVGTQGFIPPEGIGTASGDVFALGKLLAETLDSSGGGNDEAIAALCDIILTAHADDPGERFASARLLGDALQRWQNKYLPPPYPVV